MMREVRSLPSSSLIHCVIFTLTFWHVHYENGIYASTLNSAEPLNVLQVAKLANASDFVSEIEKTSSELKIRLTSPGHFTLFAPSNAGFKNLPDDVKRNKTLMESIIRYHVGKDAIGLRQFVDDTTVYSLLPNMELRLSRYNFRPPQLFTLFVEGVRVRRADLPATNGRVYILDDVIFPIPTKSVFEYLKGIPDLSTLTSFLKKDNMDFILNDGLHFTLFAPSNEAFMNLPGDISHQLQTNITLLDDTLRYHIVASTYYTAAVPPYTHHLTLTTELFKRLNVTVYNGAASVNDANIVNANITVTNGVIHIINTVLLPPSQ